MEDKQQARNAYVICMVLLLAFLAITIMYAYLAIQSPAWQLFILTGVMLTVTILTGIGTRSVQNNQIEFGVRLAVMSVVVALPMASFLVSKLGIFLGIAQFIGLNLAITLVLPRKNIVRLGIFNTLSSILTFLIGLLGSPYQLTLPIVQTIVFVVVSLGLLVFIAILFREFRNFGLQTKVSIGILVTGGLSLSILAIFAFNRSTSLINILADRVETSINLLAQEQLINTVSSEATRADSSFNSTVSQVQGLADQLDLLQEEKSKLGQGNYWNAADSLFRGKQGQYANGAYTPSSVFVPSTTEFNENLINELNVTAYLDFSAPFVLENNKQIIAIYYTNLNGVITYYPNNRLGSKLPHDYDGTAQPTFRVATPLFNAKKESRWSFPRQDPTGTGLIVSVSHPVYFKDQFKGVMVADFQLQRVAEQISSITVGKTGYAFLLDSDGHIISMPEQGYTFFELKPEVLSMNEEPHQTIFDSNVPFEVRQITSRMVAGGSGVITTTVNGVDTFIAYAPVANNSFSLGLIVPTSELTQPVIATRNEINIEVQNALRNAVFILSILLGGAILISLVLGQLIAAPVRRLTQTANQILEGDLGAQADIASRDETGTLAQAFNAMTSRLRETLSGLEKTVDERTAQLMTVNESNQRRAKQFQSIALVARTISSTFELESLLTQITTVISREFGFYHVGVFLLDTAKEYAVLSAANSAGGQTMLARGHRLKVGEKGLVGFVASTGRPRLALDTGADAVFFNNPDLPDTRSEIALPLRTGDQIIGVLDVQSVESNAFSQEDVAILSTLAEQVSIAIQNARQSEETERILSESQALSRQFVQAGWKDFSKRKNLVGVQHSGAKTTLLYSQNAKGEDSTPKVTSRLKSRGRGAILSIPIKLRGEVIGSVDVTAPENRQWDQDEMDIVEAIIERAAIAMENSRLLEEAQRRASREQTIGEMSANIGAYTDTEAILRATVNEIGQKIGGARVVFELGTSNENEKRSKSK